LNNLEKYKNKKVNNATKYKKGIPTKKKLAIFFVRQIT
jgi:hypothetical protein